PVLQARATDVEYGPPTGATDTAKVALPPGDTVAPDGVTSVEKSVTVMSRSVVAAKPTPLLLTPTLTVEGPNGQVIVAPGEVPQPPVNVKRVSAHWLGSTNPNCEGDSAAPSGVVPSIT